MKVNVTRNIAPNLMHMLKNYFKIAIKVLRRNKLYTFISLFGISFTLMVLILVSAVLENELGGNPPLSKGKRILFLPTLVGEGFQKETVMTFDTTEVNGVMKIDSTPIVKINQGVVETTSSSSIGYRFYKENIQKMKTPELTSIFIDYAPLNVYPNGKKLALNGNMADENYWKIFDFHFVEGGPFTKAAVENQANYIILRQSVAEKYFGRQDSYLGKEVSWGIKGSFKVTGIVKDIASSNRSVRADFFVPFTWVFTTEMGQDQPGYFGMCVSALLAPDAASVPKMEEELRHLENNLEKQAGFDRFTIKEKNVSDIYAWNLIGSQMKRDGKKFLLIILSVLTLFILIPTLNLVNLNVTRIIERSSEIGVRKAFGAKATDLLGQFLFENLIITFIGGLLGGLFAFLVLQWVNRSGIFGNVQFNFNFSVLLLSVGITFIFGVLSGLLPAWRVSGTQVAQALKSGNL